MYVQVLYLIFVSIKKPTRGKEDSRVTNDIRVTEVMKTE